MQVPAGSSAPKPSPVSQKPGPPIDDFNPFADLPDSNELPRQNRDAELLEMPLQPKPVDDSPKDSEFTNMARGISTTSESSAGFHIDNTLVALLASIIFVIFGGMLWGLVAKYAHMELGLIAWAIGILAGLGVSLFTTSRGTLLGLALAFIALFGILCGKYFVAKWHNMPMLMAALEKKGISSFVDPNNVKLPEETVRKIMTEPGYMFGLVAMQLADDGKIPAEDAEHYVTRNFTRIYSKDKQGGDMVLDEAAQQKKELRLKEVEKKVYKCLAEWDDQKKADVVRVQYPKMMKKLAAVFEKSGFMNVVGFAVAYVSAFSFFDLIWFPLAMVTAYKFGTGENS
jgi:hypothetical protein